MIFHPLKECFILKENMQDMLTKGIIQLDQKYDTASVNMVAFGSFKPINIEPIRSKTVEFRLINKVESNNGLVSVTTVCGETIWVHPDLIKDSGWETVKSKSTSKRRAKTKKSLRNSYPVIRVQPIKEASKEMEPSPRKKAPAESFELMRKHITLADFLLPLSEEEDELQISIAI